MNKREELFESNTQSMKIKDLNSVKGVLTVAYLNNVDTNISKEQEHFLVSLYMKNKKTSYSFKLNGDKPISIKTLQDEKEYLSFTKHQSPWSENFIITFKKSDDLNLTFYSNQSALVLMSFSKDL
jgi:hypothetical protein